MTAADEIRTLEQQLAAAEERAAYWRNEALKSAEARTVAALREGLGLTPSEAWLLATLHAAGGKVVRKVLLNENLPRRNQADEVESDVATVLICRIRARLGPGSIITHRSTGYALGSAAMQQCTRIIEGGIPCESDCLVSA